ncbi:MAG: curli-like amyloid fiber formation chaperone CsgH [Balneolales bacterium]
MILIILLTITMFIANPSTNSQQELKPDKYIADIEIEKMSSGTKFQAVFQNNSSDWVKFVYRISIIQRGISGHNSSSEGGLFEAAPGEKIPLSQVNLNLQNNDTYSITLEVFYGQEVIAEKAIRSSLQNK